MTRDFGASGGIGGHHSARARTDVWLTPPNIIDALGGAQSFDLDPCAAPDPRPWPTARRHYALPENGLALPWDGRVWMNPPYSSTEIGRWLARLAGHGTGLALIFARTETAAFFRHVWETADALLFLEGRLHFHDSAGVRAKANGGAPSVLCAYGRDDADCLAATGLPGAFVPLRLRALVFGHSPDGATWADAIREAMDTIGGRATLADLYRALAGSPNAKRNQHWQAKIRQMLQRGPYRRVEHGIWELAI